MMQLRIDNGLGYDNVVGGCDFDVLAIALNEGNRMTKCLDDRSIVGEGIPIRLLVSSLKELKLECLRCLNQTIFASWDSLRITQK